MTKISIRTVNKALAATGAKELSRIMKGSSAPPPKPIFIHRTSGRGTLLYFCPSEMNTWWHYHNILVPL